MPRILLGLIFDVVAGLVITGVLAALVVAALPTRPDSQAWLWLLAIISSIAVGTARRCLVSGSRGRSPFGSARRIVSRTGRER